MGMTNKTHRLPAGDYSTHLITVDTSAYANGDVIGGLVNLKALVGSGGGGTIRSISVTDEDGNDAALRFYFFDAKPEVIADNAAFSFTDAGGELEKNIDYATLTAYETIDGISKGFVRDVNLSHGGGELWLYIVNASGGAVTYTETDSLRISITGWLD